MKDREKTMVNKRPLRVKILGYAFLIVGLPLLFFALTELVIRVAGINTEVVKSDRFEVGVPLWAMDPANLAVARDVYRQVLDNALPVDSVEWLNHFEEAPYVHYRMKPKFSGYVTNTVNRRELEKGIKVYWESNSLGYRTGEIPRRKDPSSFRIFFLGDSTTFGWGVDQDERFTEILGTRLNADQNTVSYEIYNFGIPGYTTHHARMLYDHVIRRLQPDMIVYTFGANDSRMVPADIKKMLRQSAFIEGLKDMMGRFRTYRLLRKMVFSLYDPFEKVRKHSAAEGGGEEEAFVTLWEYQQNLEYLIRSGEKNGVETVLLALCCPLDYLSKMSAVGGREGVPAVDGMHILLQELPCIQAGECYTELAAYYRDLYGSELLENRRLLYVTSDTCHPNRLGHRILAEALFTRLFEERLSVPPAY